MVCLLKGWGINKRFFVTLTDMSFKWVPTGKNSYDIIDRKLIKVYSASGDHLVFGQFSLKIIR